MIVDFWHLRALSHQCHSVLIMDLGNFKHRKYLAQWSSARGWRSRCLGWGVLLVCRRGGQRSQQSVWLEQSHSSTNVPIENASSALRSTNVVYVPDLVRFREQATQGSWDPAALLWTPQRSRASQFSLASFSSQLQCPPWFFKPPTSRLHSQREGKCAANWKSKEGKHEVPIESLQPLQNHTLKSLWGLWAQSLFTVSQIPSPSSFMRPGLTVPLMVMVVREDVGPLSCL